MSSYGLWPFSATIHCNSLSLTMSGQLNGHVNGDGDDVKEKLERWAKRLESLPSLALPTDYPRPSES